MALNNLAYALAIHRRAPSEGRPLAERAVQLSNRNPAVVDTLGWIEYLLGNHAVATRLLREAASGAPNVAPIRVNAAFALAATGEIAEAREHLNAALRLNPSISDRADIQDLLTRLEGRGK